MKAQKLVTTDVEENVPQYATFSDAECIGDDGLEAQDVFVKGASLVEVQRREADVGKALVAHAR
jgi:hypothetical protein